VRILVGGEARKSGKTTLVCEILRWFPECRWVAVKVSSHRHEETHPWGGDTARYREAGAVEAVLIEGVGAAAAEQVETALSGWGAACIEGTGVGAWLQADVRLLVRAQGAERKAVAADETFRPDAYVGEAREGDTVASFAPGSQSLREFLVKRWKEK
jgi:hypothetical protein